jgi:hypothetical protein
LEIAHDPAQASSESNETLINVKKPTGLVASCVIITFKWIAFDTFNYFTVNYFTVNYFTFNYFTFVEVNGIASAEKNWFIVFIITSGATRCSPSQGMAHWRSASALSLVCRNNCLIVGGIDCLERQRPSCQRQQTARLRRRSARVKYQNSCRPRNHF